MADPNDVILKLFLDASKFEGGLNQAQRSLDKLGAVIQLGTQKFEVYQDAAGATLGKLTALTTLGDKVAVSFEKLGNSFQVTSAKITQGVDTFVAATESRKERLTRLFIEAQERDVKLTESTRNETLKRAQFENQAAAQLQSTFTREAEANTAAFLTIAGNREQDAAARQKALLDIQNQVNARTIFEKEAAEKLKALIDADITQRERWAAAAQRAAQEAAEGEQKALEIAASAKAKALEKDRTNQLKERAAFEDEAAKNLQKTFAREATEEQKKTDAINAEIQKRAAFENQYEQVREKILQQEANTNAENLARFTADYRAEVAAKLKATNDIKQQILDRQKFENDTAEKLSAVARKETQAKRTELNQQFADRLKFENDAAAKLTATFAKEGEARKKIARDIAKAEFDAFAQSAADKQKLAQQDANRPGFLSGLNRRLNPFATAESTGAFAGSFAGNLAAQGAGAAFSALKQGFDEAIGFEQAIARLQATQRGTKLTTDQLARSVLDLSNSFNIERNDVINAKITVFQNTLAKTDAEANKVVESAAKLSKLTGSTLNDSVETITTSLNAFGLSIGDADRVSELLFATFKNGGPSVRETSTVLGQIGALLSPFGAKINDVAAILAAFNKRGLSANETLTALVNIFTRLANPLSDKGLKDFLGGLSLEEIISSKGVIGLLQSLADKAKTGASELSELFAQGKSGKSGVAVLGAIGDIVEQEKLLSVSTNEASNALKTLQENSGEKLANSLNQSKNAFLELGEALLNTSIFQTIAEALKNAAEFNKRNTSDTQDLNKAIDEEVDKLARLNAALKSLKETGRIAPSIDVSGIQNSFNGGEAPLQASAKKLGVTDNILLDKLSQNQGLSEQDLIRLNRNNQAAPFAFTGIREEQERRQALKKFEDESKTNNIKVTKDFSSSLEEQNRAAFAAYNERLDAHRKYVETVVDKEKALTQSIKNELLIQVQRAEEGVHRIEEVAKKSLEIRKKLAEEKQTRADAFRTSELQAQIKLTPDPKQKQQLEEFRQDQLKNNAAKLLEDLPKLNGSAFLESRNLELAKQKLSEFVKIRQDARDLAIDEFQKGNISQSQLQQAQGEYIDSLRVENELLDKAAAALDAKEKATKAIADAQKKLVEDVKKDVSNIIDFNPFVKKDERAGSRGISGSREEQISKFDTIVERIKSQESKLTLDQAINIDSKIKERRDQLLRELDQEGSERDLAIKGAGLRSQAEANVKGTSVQGTPDQFRQGQQLLNNENVHKGLQDLANGLQTADSTFNILTSGQNSIKDKLEVFSASIEKATQTLDLSQFKGPASLTGQEARVPDVDPKLNLQGKFSFNGQEAGIPDFDSKAFHDAKLKQALENAQKVNADDAATVREKKPSFDPNVKGPDGKPVSNNNNNSVHIGRIDIKASGSDMDPKEFVDNLAQQITKEARRGRFRSTNFGE